jgi:hypothetical protein
MSTHNAQLIPFLCLPLLPLLLLLLLLLLQ